MDIDKIIRETKNTDELIFDYRFLVKVPHQETRSLEDLSRRGTRLSDLPELNSSVSKEIRQCYLNIAQMTDYFKEGIVVAVPRHEDTKTIYRFVSAHIEKWKEIIVNRLNVGNAPLEDLIALDEFAAKVYKHARHHMKEPAFVDIINTKMGGNPLISMHDIFKNYDAINHQIVEDKKTSEGKIELPEHEDSLEFFKSRILAQSAFGARRGNKH